MKSHDLSLPAWGPYSKAYAGISHIPDPAAGMRFDLAVFPGFYRRRVDVPNVNWEGQYYPWQARPDLSSFTYRHELEWKDRVYVDTEFIRVSDTTRLIRAVACSRR